MCSIIRNTKFFFHVVVKKRRVVNKITRLKVEDGDWIKNYHQLEILPNTYFVNMYKQDNGMLTSEIA